MKAILIAIAAFCAVEVRLFTCFIFLQLAIDFYVEI